MSVLGTPWVAAAVARVMQGLAAVTLDMVARRRGMTVPEFAGNTDDIMIPTSIAPARAVVYRPAGQGPCPPVHVNFHGGGFVMRGVRLDDPLCRYLAARPRWWWSTSTTWSRRSIRFPHRRARPSRSSGGWPSTARSTGGTAGG